MSLSLATVRYAGGWPGAVLDGVMTDPIGRQLGTGGLHLSGSRTGTVQSRGTAGLVSTGQRVVVLNEDALRCLAVEAKIQDSKKGKMDDIIEKQVNDFLDSLDKKTKAQLSKTQLIKSVQKVYKWRKELRHRKSSSTIKAIPKEYLEADLDPGAYREKHFKAILARGGPVIGNGSSSGSPGSPPSSLNASNSSLAPPNAFSGGAERAERALDGEHFENFILPTCPSRDKETAISAKRALQMKDWLARRANYQMERDRIKKWLATMSKKDDLSQEELLRIYQRKRKELSLDQIKDILNMVVRFKYFRPLFLFFGPANGRVRSVRLFYFICVGIGSTRHSDRDVAAISTFMNTHNKLGSYFATVDVSAIIPFSASLLQR